MVIVGYTVLDTATGSATEYCTIKILKGTRHKAYVQNGRKIREITNLLRRARESVGYL